MNAELSQLPQELPDMVSMWRLQEYIFISFFSFYTYYVLTSLDEEASVIHPQRWNRGKALYMAMRYGTLSYIALHLSRDYRNYFEITQRGCKALAILQTSCRWLAVLASDLSLGLCLGALLQADAIHAILIVPLGSASSLITAVCEVAATIQYPAQPISPLYRELGYPCYVPSPKQWSEQTIALAGQDIRAYANLAATTFSFLLGLIVFGSRYKGHPGRLVQVMRRDGGIYYMCLLAIRLVLAITRTPTVQSALAVDANPAALLAYTANGIIIPVLAQRLLINMRKVTYLGVEPIASKLLFVNTVAEPENGAEDDVIESFELTSRLRSQRGGGSRTRRRP